MWFLLALISALLAGARKTTEKQLLQKTNQFALGGSVQLLSLPIMFAAIPFSGELINPLSLGLRFWLPILLGMLLFYPLNTWLAGQAIKHGELSKVMPVQSLGPIFSMLFAFLVVGQIPSLFAAAAILLICLGVYALNLKGKTLHSPLSVFKEDRASYYMLCSTALIAAFVPLDVIALKASNATTYGIVSTLSAVIALLFMSAKAHKTLFPAKKLLGTLCILGIVQGVAYLTVILALTTGPIAYISAIKSSSILVSALSGIVILKERFTPNKLFAFTAIAIGLTLLAFS